MSGALAGRREVKELNKGRVEATKVRRYWPGKRPDWVKEEDEDEEEFDEDEEEPSGPAPEAEPVVRTGISAPVIVKRADDHRLRRLAEAQPAADRGEARHRHREVAEPQIVRRRERPASDDEGAGLGRMGLSDEDEDEEAVAARRAAVRERLRQQQAAAAAAAQQQQQQEAAEEEEEEEESEEEGSSEYTTDDSEDEALGGRQLMKPVFVPKTDRETIQEREMLEKEEEERAQQEKLRLERRKEETREIVVQRVQEEAAMAASVQAGPKGMDEVDTDDEKDEESEYEQWKLREMKRIARDRDEREREQKEAEEKERWRNMSEEERQRWLRLHPKGQAAAASKKKWRFLQKYWHRGAFFQTVADTGEGEDAGVATTITRRDFSAPTGEDKMDKSILPQIMQVKNFGRRGRTKWTHLVAEDTTNFESPWAQNDTLRMKYDRKMAAAEQVFTKPKNLKT